MVPGRELKDTLISWLGVCRWYCFSGTCIHNTSRRNYIGNCYSVEGQNIEVTHYFTLEKSLFVFSCNIPWTLHFLQIQHVRAPGIHSSERGSFGSVDRLWCRWHKLKRHPLAAWCVYSGMAFTNLDFYNGFLKKWVPVLWAKRNPSRNWSSLSINGSLQEGNDRYIGIETICFC